MSQTEDKELEDYEESDPFVYEHIEITDDEIHDKYESDYGDAEEIWRYVALQYVSIKYIHDNSLVKSKSSGASRIVPFGQVHQLFRRRRPEVMK